ncbi:MAG: hypothetical protein RIQ89_2275 [Bacteroidota bacterium]|jgi:CxxC motif-containing protein (DUF1111 family)
MNFDINNKIRSLAIIMVLLTSCSKFEPIAPKAEDTLDGPIDGLSQEQHLQFLKGDAAVNKVFTSQTGLGPIFVSNSCISCHLGDGRGTPFTTLTRFGQTDSTGNQYLRQGGPQLQNRAIQGYFPEQIPQGASSSKFTPPSITGMGYLQFVTDQTILDLSDPYDVDGDGISGVPNWISIPNRITPNPFSINNDGKYIGRFGKKASAYNLLHQTVNAYSQDMGISSFFEPIDVYSGLVIDPEVSVQEINDVVAYLNTLKAPIQRQSIVPDVQLGKNIFVQIRCGSCHVPQLNTGFSNVEALSYKIFYPYTDLLLHDMGIGLDDGYTEGSAKSSEWRTPPLWGLGLSSNSQGGQYFLLHDGRARSIEQAIEMHGGEATNSKVSYQNLSPNERTMLIKFLKSL